MDCYLPENGTGRSELKSDTVPRADFDEALVLLRKLEDVVTDSVSCPLCEDNGDCRLNTFLKKWGR